MKKLIAFLCLVLTGQLLFAQAPQATSYQAVIRNSSGNVLSNQLVKVRFSIRDSSANGTIVYRETQNPTTNAQGLINLFAGQGTATTGTFATINWGSKSKFLQTEIDITGGTNYTDMGTTQLMSVPYALYANTANNGMPTGAAAGEMLYWNGTTWVKVAPGSYGQLLTFCDGVPTWGGCLPRVTTTNPYFIDSNFANCGGNVTSDGGYPLLAKGVCWSTNSNPTISLTTKTDDGPGAGEFTTVIPALTNNTTYYVRAYATNGVGTVYGNQHVFTTRSVDHSISATIIGTQEWSRFNLDVTRYRNGDLIPQVTNGAQWASLTTGAWCWYNNDSATYASTYGRLYNWYAVNDPRVLAPQGWRIPSDGDWNKLVKYIDLNADTTCSNCIQSTVAGGALKSVEGIWTAPNTGATNSSTFRGRPGGTRTSNGLVFTAVGAFGYWWTSSSSGSVGAWGRSLFYNSTNVTKTNYDKPNGFSVRVVRD